MTEANEVAPTALVEPEEHQALNHRRVLIIMGALLLGMLLAALDQTIVSTALPTIVGDLGGADHLAWVVVAYLLASTASMPLWGKLGDLYGRKRLFQLTIILFLLGSVLSGISQTMTELIIFRALQGLGGGGLMIGTQAIIGDVVSPCDRGRYMGLFGAMFGVTTVIGPLIGGLLVEYASWRWIFYINLPIGAVALAVTATVLPKDADRVRRVIDYAGTLLIAASATCLVLYVSLGGVTYPWFSPAMIGFLVAGVVFGFLFIVAEQRAAEPLLPLQLFKNRVFSAASSVGFVMGFAMYGAITFLPLFFQLVKGVSPTASGVRLFPMMFGLFVAAIGSGQIISRWGRYKVFPVVGTALMTVGLWLLSHIGVLTNGWVVAFYMLVFGVGLGLTMQVLVVAVQNAVPYEQLGVATSGVTFFRQIGGSFGASIFGAVYANQIVGNLSHYLHGVPLPHNLSSETLDPSALSHLPPAIESALAHGVAATVQSLFILAVPVAALSFALAWLLPEIELRRSVRTGADTGEAFAMPEDRSSLQEVERVVVAMTNRESRVDLYRAMAERAHVQLDPRSVWLLYRLFDEPSCSVESLAARFNRPTKEVQAWVDTLAEAGMIESVKASRPTMLSASAGDAGRVVAGDGHGRVGGEASSGSFQMTVVGRHAMEQLGEARRAGLADLLEDWNPEEHQELDDLIQQLAKQLLADDQKLLRELHAVVA